ncbi:Putative lipopolysaccharide biosynthesis O-acetyl transferase WbbJ [Vibrio owensii]|uniref:DapH/DapD/GlmU-related protein n=1 Tax=Vibrio owensii TaxID=696485 RepID=UPI002894CEB3|nr:Putative lipopolysaccharide biosynthesis O-acetyl transferase WbbJ [Vibrio owensii]
MREIYLRYGVAGFIRLIRDVLLTKIFYPSSKLIRRPIDIRGERFICFHPGLTTGRYCRIEAYNIKGDNVTLLTIGKRCQMNDFVHITATNRVSIGDDVLIASKVYISDTNHGSYNGEWHSEPTERVVSRALSSGEVVIGDNVWIGEGVAILSDVTLGNNVIVAANSVVTKSFPDDVIVAGVPAVIIKKYNHEKRKWERFNAR